jgi:hypothetical protein
MFERLSIFIPAMAAVAATALPMLAFGQGVTDRDVPNLRGDIQPGLQRPETGDRADQVSAALANAVDKLHDDIADERLSPQLTVGEFLNRTNAHDRLLDTLRRGQQIGGPRWIDDRTCQLKLAVPAEQVARTLIDVANGAGPKSPIPAEALAVKLKDWKGRTFIETGTSLAPSAVNMLRPMDNNGPWRQVAEDERRRAVTAAKQNAVQRVIDSLRTIELAPGPTVADAMADKKFADQFAQWLASRPVTGVQFRPDLFVELTLGVNRGELFDAFVNTARATGAIKIPDDPQQLAELRQEFDERVGQAIGRAHVAINLGNPPPQTSTSQNTAFASMSPVVIPTQPPDWARRAVALHGDGSAPLRRTQLLTTQAAENSAYDDLRGQIDQLPLEGSITVGQAARQDPAVARAVEQAVRRAKVYKIDYRADGGANIKVSLDARDLWDELRRVP